MIFRRSSGAARVDPPSDPGRCIPPQTFDGRYGSNICDLFKKPPTTFPKICSSGCECFFGVGFVCFPGVPESNPMSAEIDGEDDKSWRPGCRDGRRGTHHPSPYGARAGSANSSDRVCSIPHPLPGESAPNGNWPYARGLFPKIRTWIRQHSPPLIQRYLDFPFPPRLQLSIPNPSSPQRDGKTPILGDGCVSPIPPLGVRGGLTRSPGGRVVRPGAWVGLPLPEGDDGCLEPFRRSLPRHGPGLCG